MEGRPAPTHTQEAGPILKGGYMLHSPESRMAAAKMSLGYMVATAAIIVALVVESGHFSALTAVLLASTGVAIIVMRKTRWDLVSLTRMTSIYWANVLMFVAIAIDFGSPEVLLGVYPSLLVLTDAWWYRRWVTVLNLFIGFGLFTAVAFAIAGSEALGSVMIEVPLMVASIITLASFSNSFVSTLLHRQHLGGTVMALMHALHARDGYSAEHSADSLAMALAVGDRLDLTDKQMSELSDVALMHNIGKIGIPNAILEKPDELNDEEWAAMREHPVIGAWIVGDLPGFESVATAIGHSHERWDGTGYPDRLAGDDIPIASRIVLVCDAYLAMTSDRPYRAAMSPEIAREELSRNAGTQFDPAIVPEFLAALDHGIDAHSRRATGHRSSMTSLVAESLAADAADRGPQNDVETDSLLPVDAIYGDAGQDDVERLSRHNAAIDDGPMRKISVRSGILSAVVAAAYFVVFDHVDRESMMLVAWFLGSAGLTLLFDRTRLSEAWYLLLTLSAFAIAPIAAAHFQEPAMLLFVLLPATAGMRHFWDRSWIRYSQIAILVANFALMPILIFGMTMFPMAIVALRAFPATIVLVGFLTERLWKVRFERGRFVSTVRSLLAALQARDGYTGDHSEETLRMVMGVADQLGLDERERNELADVALLHDVGKIGISDAILNKPGKLNDAEWAEMRKHPQIGEEIVSKVPGFEDVAKAIRHEHERWDGFGYPDGISGDDIPLASRIVLVCDAYHAMMSDRPYRKALGLEIARDELLKNSGSQFDPRVVEALLAAIDARTGEVVSGAELGDDDDDANSEHEIDHSSMEGIGMSAKAGWYASAVLYGVGGLSYLLISFGTSIPLSRSIGVLATISVIASVVWLICARVVPAAKWGPHLRISFGILLVGSVAFEIGAPVSVIVPLMMFPVLASAYLHTPRVAIPYCIAGALVATAAVMAAPAPATGTSALVTLIAFSAIALAAVYAQYQLRTMAEMNHRLSTTDPLTGCANVRRLRSRLKRDLVGTAGKYRVALYAIDLDDFKLVNDRFSHTRGDELLKAVARELSNEIDPGDLLVRRGGDEFVVVAVVSGGRNLGDLRIRLARAVKRAREEVCPQVNPHASVGYVIHQDGESADSMLARADDALHMAKLDAHPDRRARDTSVRNLAAYRRAIGAHPHDRDEAAITDEDEEVRIARWVDRALGTHTAWIVATWSSSVIAAIFAIAALTGLAPQLQSPAAIALTASFVGLALITYWASRRELAVGWLNGFVIASFALLTAMIEVSGSASPDFVDLYVFPTLFACYFLPTKRAIGYLALGSVLFSLELYTSPYPFAIAKILMSFLVILLMGGLLARARSATLAFASRAVETSVVDPLTGAANLRGLRQRVADEIARSEFTGKRIAVIGIDIDDFKSVNDIYSHALGDNVLRATVEATRECLRAEELVARRGGDEFAAVCAVTDPRDADLIAARVRETIARARFELCPDLLATASVAVTIRRHDEPLDEFLARVDDDLHDAKQRSRSARETETTLISA